MREIFDLPYNPKEFKEFIEKFHPVNEVQKLIKSINNKVYNARVIPTQATALEKLFSTHSKQIPYSKEFELEIEPMLKLGVFLEKINPKAKIELRSLLENQPNYDGEIKIDGNIKKIEITSFFDGSTKGLINHSKRNTGRTPILQKYYAEGTIKEKIDTVMADELIEEFEKELKIRLENKLAAKHIYSKNTWLLIYLPFPHRLCLTILNSFEKNIKFIGFASLEAPTEWQSIATDSYPKKIMQILWETMNNLKLERLFLVSDIRNSKNDSFVYFDSA